MKIERNLQIEGSNGRPILFDLYYRTDGIPKPVIVFAHGFKGFKDWGHWDLIARAFAQNGFVFLKFNFSHNGTTPEQPLDFADLDAFGRNNYTKELTDLDAVLNWLYLDMEGPPREEVHLKDLCLIGHSRGGAIALLKANLDDRAAALITWASVSSFDYAWREPDFPAEWKEKGVYYQLNARTGQEMPLYYQLYEDFKSHEEILDAQKAARQLNKPFLIIHGTEDTSVPAEAAQELHRWAPGSELHLITGADHVFGGRHPYPSGELPEHSRQLVEKCMTWLKGIFE
jgi:uncharacterized protein